MHRRVWLLVAVSAALALALGTGGFSAASIDRGVTVNVADHENAYVGLADPGTQGTHPYWMPQQYRSETPVNENDRTTRLFVVRNGLGPGQLRVTARNAADNGVTLIDAETKWVSASTGPQAVSGSVECPDGVHGPTQLDLTVVVDDADGTFHAEIDYPVTVVCATPDGKEGKDDGTDGTDDEGDGKNDESDGTDGTDDESDD